MAENDKISIPVDVPLADAEKAVKKLADRLQGQLGRSLKEAQQNLPGIPSQITVTGKERFAGGGKQWELRAKQTTEGMEASIREIRERSSAAFELDAKRMRDFKKSIQHQEPTVREAAFKDFLQQHKDLEAVTDNLLPTEQLGKIKEFIDSTSTISSRLRKSYQEDFDKFEESVKGLSPEEQQDAISDYIDRFGDMNNEIGFSLKRSTEQIRRERFDTVKSRAKRLDPENAIRLMNRYKKEPGAMVEEAFDFTQKMAEKLKRINEGKSKQRYSDVRLSTAGRPIEDQILAIETYLANGGKRVMQANADLRKLNQQLGNVQRVSQHRRFSQVGIQAKGQEPEDALKLFEDYKQEPGALQEQADAMIRQLNQRIKRKGVTAEKKTYSDLKLDVAGKELPDQIAAIMQYLANGGKMIKQANADLRKLRARLDVKQFRDMQSRVDLPIEARIRLFEHYIDWGGKFDLKAKTEISKLEKQLASQQQKNLGIDIRGLSSAEQLIKLQEALANKVGNAPQIEAQIRVVERQIAAADAINKKKARQDTRRLRNQGFKDLKEDIEMLDLPEKLKRIDDYIQKPGAKLKAAANLYARYEKQLARHALKDLKLDLTGKTLDESIVAVQDFAKAWPIFQKETDAILRSLSGQWVKKTKGLQKTKFDKWLKGVQAKDPTEGMKDLETAIAAGPSKFMDEMKIALARMKQKFGVTQSAEARDKARAFANRVLVGAGAGLGLLGPMGFPLLNVGFSAMSGGKEGAIISAVTTAIGETIRYIEALADAAEAAAKGLNFIPTSLKTAEAQLRAYEAFTGSGILSSRRTGMERRMEILQAKDPTATRGFYREWTDFKEAASNTFESFNFRKGAPSKEYKGLLPEWLIQQAKSKAGEYEDLVSSRRNMKLAMQQGMPGIENDPYQTWLRMQQSAMDPMKQEELRLQRKTIETMDKLIEAYKTGGTESIVSQLASGGDIATNMIFSQLVSVGHLIKMMTGY